MLKKIAIISIFVTLMGCASSQASSANSQNEDTLRPFNKVTYNVVMTLEKYIMRPLGKTYKFVVPKFVRQGVTNFFSNLTHPFYMVNNLFQADGQSFADNFGRFLVNTTVGVGGLFDVASSMGNFKHSTDIGTTLAYYDVAEGPYLFLYMPSNVRDTAGDLAGFFLDPKDYAYAAVGGGWIFAGVNSFNSYVNYIPLIEQAESMSLDGYTGMRSMWTQYRTKQVRENLRRAGKPGMEEPKSAMEGFSMDLDDDDDF